MAHQSNEKIFRDIYRTNAWNDSESRSGTGSNLRVTEGIRKEIPKLLHELGIQPILDAPCGDFNWMRHVDLKGIDYIGVDVVSDIIEANQKYSGPERRFLRLDITQDDLPKVDLIFCRDALPHFTYSAIEKTLRNFQRSGSTYLLTTTHIGSSNRDVPVMSYSRPIDLQCEPFNFPDPLRLISDDGEGKGKYLGLWRLSDI